MRLQDDFYRFINNDWLQTAEIPSDRSAINTFSVLDIDLEKMNLEQVEKWLAEPNLIADNQHLLNYTKLYALAKNKERRARNELPVLLKHLEKLQNYHSFADLAENYAALTEDGFSFPLTFVSYNNLKDSEHYMLYSSPSDTFMPDSTYYAEDNEQGKALLEKFEACAKDFLLLMGLDNAEVERIVNEAMAFDRSYAVFTKTSEERADYTDIYHPLSLQDLFASLPAALQALKGQLCEMWQIEDTTIISNSEPRFIENVAAFVNEDNFKNYRSWAYLRFALDNSAYLSEELRVAGGAFRRALQGIAEAPALEKYAFGVAHGIYGMAVGLDYAKRKFGAEAKANVLNMLKNMIDVYADRLQKNDWLGAATKEKAISKLRNLTLHIAYPERVSPLLDELVIEERGEDSSLLENMLRFDKLSSAYQYRIFNKPVDRDLWHMSPDTINAYYSPTDNCIVFPAAILQAPFYDLQASKAANYGGIGAVMAHEISHAFDNNGARMDEKGNLENWWTADDFAAFDAKAKGMIELFEGRDTEYGKCNGALTVSENIADAGGLACALEACLKEDAEHIEDFFKSWATNWRQISSPERAKMLLNVDVHAPNELRANVQLMNLPKFQEFYDIQETDKMYLPADKFVAIW